MLGQAALGEVPLGGITPSSSAAFTPGLFATLDTAPRMATAAALQRFSDFAPAGFVTSITQQGWWGQSPDLFAQPYKVELQQFVANQLIGNVPTAITPQGWWGQPPDLFAKPFAALLQRVEDFAPAGAITVFVTPTNFWFGASPEQIAKPVLAAIQQFAEFGPLGTPPLPPPPPNLPAAFSLLSNIETCTEVVSF